MNNKRVKVLSTSLVLLIFCFSVLASGCEPLRKKFTRKKKISTGEQEFEPILEPIVYPEKIFNPSDEYEKRFSLFRVWQKEFISAIDDRSHEKRLNYLMNNLMTQIEEMQGLLSDKKSSELKVQIDRLKECQVNLQKPEGFRDLTSVKRKVKSVSNEIISDFSLDSVKEQIKK